MASINGRISLKHGYMVHEDDNGILDIKVDDYEFEGYKGNIITAGEWTADDEVIEMTLEEMLQGATEFFTDYGIDEDTVSNLVKHLTPWFKRYAISDEKATANEIAKLESWLNGRRESIAKRVQSIDNCRKEIRVYEERIGYETSEILRLNEDIEDLVRKIATLKAKLNGDHPNSSPYFVAVEPQYTGGGIYVFLGTLTNGNGFIADTACYDVRILNEDPSKCGIKYPDEDAFPSVEWQEEHLIEDLKPIEAKAFFIKMLEWIIANDPTGNYNDGDMEYFLNEVKSLEGNWR